MKNSVVVSVVTLCFGFIACSDVRGQDAKSEPIRALLIAGGCCHDYAKQQLAIQQGIQAQANVRVDVYWTDNSTTAPLFPLYSKLNWAEEYDVIIHDECAADITDPALLQRIVQVHQKIPAVHLHCAMHSFRTGSDAWFRHLGLQSTGHGPQEPIAIEFVDTQHPITQTLGNWTTIREELYNNVEVFGAHSLAVGQQAVGGSKPRVDQAIVAWTNETQGARSFSTTLGHNTETVQDTRYLELVTRGLLWACDRLSPEYLVPYAGESNATFIDAAKVKRPDPMALGRPPEGATLVKITASSTQSGHPAEHALDGDPATRWCADGSSYPQWLQIELETPRIIRSIEIDWESRGAAYQYRVEGSNDGQSWRMLLDQSKNTKAGLGRELLTAQEETRFVRITGVSSKAGWCSLWNVALDGEGIGRLWPADPKAPAGAFVPIQADIYGERGNTVPRLERLTAQAESEILKDVRVPEGFEATVFASPPAVNYPVFVAADVDGTLYVSSDGNGSLGRAPERGRVIRLRDFDGDGRADETKVFCEIDAPRGLVWDRDRLYLMHPPHLSAFIDHNGDGVADEQKTLVKNLAFGYDQRPADHTTNGVSLGVDGWLYIAGGDFGFIDATGTDGRKLTHRGGGVIRVRPDGTGLELYSTGTRNILEVAISPAMEMFARDNTNDGGGWDVRLHHFTGADDHGYPRLYKNFNEECVQPLADYGGGSGCGAVFIDEPGFGRWNAAPFTADWGTGSLFRHTVTARGSTFEETQPPEPFIQLTRPTDADVDGNSRVYCASWRGATFDWAGPDVGYIVCVKPKGFQPDPLPEIERSSDAVLLTLLDCKSHRRRLAAARELNRRGHSAADTLLERGIASRSSARNRIDHLQHRASNNERIEALESEDALVVHTAIRCLAKQLAAAECLEALSTRSVAPKPLLRALAMMHTSQVVDGLISELTRSDATMRREILAALCRLHFQEGRWTGDSWGTRPDTRGPYYQPEPWAETSKIAAMLNQSLASATADEAAYLLATMDRSRIQTSESSEQMLQLAESSDALLETALRRLASAGEVPARGVGLLLRTANRQDATVPMLLDTVTALSKLRRPEVPQALLSALQILDTKDGSEGERTKAREAFLNSVELDAFVNVYAEAAENDEADQAVWADMALLSIVTRKNTSPEARDVAKQVIKKTWSDPARRVRIIQAAVRAGNHFLDDEILAASKDSDVSVADVARAAVRQLKIQAKRADASPKIATLALDMVQTQAVALRGDVVLGEQIFVRANCVACHTVRQDEVQKGPYLGNIAKTYKRPELVAAVLEPSKTIAQGFVTQSILTTDGTVLTGFVTAEESDRVTLRDQLGKEVTVMKVEIDERRTSTTSVMPVGVMNEYSLHEFASLIDYLESLSQ